MSTGPRASGIDMDDPIFAVLDAANTAETGHVRACEGLDENDDAAVRQCNAACDQAGAARRAVMRTMPTTLGGLRALAGYYARWGEEWAEDSFAHIARALEGCESKQPLRPHCEAKPHQSETFASANPPDTFLVVPGLPEITAAWRSLPPAIQERIGVAVVDMVFNDFVHGDACVVGEQPQDRAFPDETDEHDAIRDAAAEASNRRLNELTPLIEGLFPDLFGQPGENPAWCPNPGPGPSRLKPAARTPTTLETKEPINAGC